MVAVVGCGGNTSVRLTATQIVVTPTPTTFALKASTQTPHGTAILERVASQVPERMPPNPAQGICTTGTRLTITVKTTVYRYGPCKWPTSIEQLRHAFLQANHVPLHASVTAGAVGWKAVFNDWYDGRFDQW